MSKLKLQSETKELISTLNAENGPVYEMQEDLEVIQLEKEAVELNASQFGAYLRVDVDGHKHMVNVRGVAPADVADEDKKLATLKKLGIKFKLQLWEAMRELPAQGNRQAIAKGTKKVFAIAA